MSTAEIAFVDDPESVAIARTLNFITPRPDGCMHGRDPCYLRCGVERVRVYMPGEYFSGHEATGWEWRVISRERRVEWRRAVFGIPIDRGDPLSSEFAFCGGGGDAHAPTVGWLRHYEDSPEAAKRREQLGQRCVCGHVSAAHGTPGPCWAHMGSNSACKCERFVAAPVPAEAKP